MRTRLWIKSFVLVLGHVAFMAAPVMAQIDADRAAKVKTSYLYKFTQYVDWPAEAHDGESTPVVVGVLGAHPFGQYLEKLATQKSRGRSIVVRRFEEAGDAPLNCHILFVGALGEKQLTAALQRVAKRPVLTVSEIDGFADRGGDIQLRLQDGRVVMRVNAAVARDRGLKLSSKLLSAAELVGS